MHRSRVAKVEPPVTARFVDAAGAAAYLGLAERTLRRWAYENRIPFYKFGPQTLRFDIADLDAFAEAGRVEAIDQW
jgi:excisionase family DNA binding protein